ncbi:MAG: CoA ester lyase [Polynucleobacter sp.]|nr:CoA ester lyase [Polynucleobacter sp.]
MSPLESTLAFCTNFLFVPGTRPDRFIKALNSGAAGVIIDLEDAVGADDKEKARSHLRQAWGDFSVAQKKQLVIRINAPGTKFYGADLALAEEINAPCLLIPKSESRDQINGAAQILPATAIIPMIETALGLDCLKEIANAQQVLRLALGNLDLQADLGRVCDDEESELLTARFQLVFQSRVAEIAPPIDGVTPTTTDENRISADANRAKRMGFGGKLCIHPSQVGIVRKAFEPSSAEIEWAKRVVQADHDAHGGAVKLDGRMIDRPVVLLAQKTLNQAK